MNTTTNRRLLIAGAAGVLGRTLVTHFAASSEASIVATTFNDAQARELADHLGSVGQEKIDIVPVDLSSHEQVASCLADRPIDCVVSACGAFRWIPTTDTTEQDYQVLLDANLKSSWLLLRNCLPGMMERNFGRVVFISALATQAAGSQGMGLYTAAKAGLNQLIQCVAAETKDYAITINALMPSIIDTPANRKDMPDADFSTWVAPEHLAQTAETVLFGLPHVHGSLLAVPGRV